MTRDARQPFEDPNFQRRRQALKQTMMEPLGELSVYTPDPSNGIETSSVHHYNAAYRRRLQHFHLHLLNDKNGADANNYFSTHEDLVSHWWNHPRNEPDWKMGPLVRVYFECYHQLSAKSCERIESLMQEFRRTISFGGTENHIINRVAISMLCDAALGIEDDKTRHAAEIFEKWVWLRGHRGYMEYNSPTYHTHCLQPLLLIHDCTHNDQWQNLAARAIDQIMVMIAIQSLNGSRGGPWHRATSPKELGDSRSDVAFIASHVFFGNCPRPPVIESAAWVTTKYRVPEIIYRIATERAALGSYEIRQRVDTVDPELDAYFFMTPHCALGCFQNSKPFNCQYYGTTHRANLQLWELSFADPTQVLGIARDLTKVSEDRNSNTALMQYRGTLLFRGRWLDYNNNLGIPMYETIGERHLCFYHIPTAVSSVFVAIIYYPEHDAGVLEVALPEKAGSWDGFVERIRSANGRCDMKSNFLSHTNLDGDCIVFDNGHATVNGNAFSLKNYPLCDSPFVSSEWDSGIIHISHDGADQYLDFRDPSVRVGHWLLGTYFLDLNFQEIAFTRQDRIIDFSWGKALPVAASHGGFSIRWIGQFLASQSGCHQFTLKTVGKASLWINGELVVSALSGNANQGMQPVVRTGAISLEAGHSYEIKVEYAQTVEEAMIIVSLSTASLPRQVLGLLCELSH